MAIGILLLSFAVLVGANINLDTPVSVTQIVGVENSTVILPCTTRSTPVAQHVGVQLILWYRLDDPEGRPVFSLDARRRGLSAANKFSALAPFGFGHRATSDDEGLRIDSLKETDAALYRCRIDYSNAPATNHLINLTIVLPPKSMDILDANESAGGPSTQRALEEGDRMHVMCRVIGGRPKPEVTWSLDGRLIDSTYESLSTDTTVNLLMMPPLARHHQGKQLECAAKNTELAPPITKFITIELLLRPLWTRVSSLDRILVAGQPVTVECRSGGSRPPARLSWWRGGQRVDEASFNYSSSADGESLSVVRLSPEPEDDERILECRAENLAISDSVVSDRWKMEVQFPVQAELRPGAHVHLKSLREGDDVFLECNVKGNPTPTHVKWLHNGVPLVPDRTAGVFRSQFVLVMQRLSRHAAGSYSCFVENSLGNSTSNSIHIIVKHPPVCATSSVLEIQVMVGQNTTLECPLTTNPAVLAVRWQRVKTTGTLMPPSQTFSFIHQLTFNKVRRTDLGRYQCWGRNAVGEQAHPCQIDLVAPGAPSEPVNCTANLQDAQLQVTCVPGEPSGLEENFLMEVLSIPDGRLRANLTTPWTPLMHWTIPWPPEPEDMATLKWNTDIFQVRVRAVSNQGFGEPFVLSYPPTNPKVPLAEASNPFNESLLTTVFSSVAVFLFFTSCLVILVLVARRRRFTQIRREAQTACNRVADKPIVRTPLPKPKVKKTQHDVDTNMPLVHNFKRETLDPSHPAKSLEVGLDQVRYTRELGITPNRLQDSSGNLMRVKSLESCI